MVTSFLCPAFCVPTPLCIPSATTHSPHPLITFRKRPRFFTTPATPCPSRMSLAADVIVKALEVGVASYVGNTVATRQPSPTSSSSSSRRPKTTRPHPVPRPSSTSVDVKHLIDEALRFAEALPALVERGGGPQGRRWVKLAICLGIDLVGSGSLAVPIVGELLDVVTAPLTAVMLQALFGSSLVTVGGFVEEILPGTDAIPTATLAWAAENWGYLRGREEDAEEE